MQEGDKTIEEERERPESVAGKIIREAEEYPAELSGVEGGGLRIEEFATGRAVKEIQQQIAALGNRLADVQAEVQRLTERVDDDEEGLVRALAEIRADIADLCKEFEDHKNPAKHPY